MFKIQLIGYFLKKAFVDKIIENFVKTEDASKHVFEKIEVDDEKTVDIEICKESFEDKINANDQIEVDVKSLDIEVINEQGHGDCEGAGGDGEGRPQIWHKSP